MNSRNNLLRISSVCMWYTYVIVKSGMRRTIVIIIKSINHGFFVDVDVIVVAMVVAMVVLRKFITSHYQQQQHQRMR